MPRKSTIEVEMEALQPVLGMVIFVGVAAALSRSRADIDWKLVVMAVAMQVALAFLMLEVGMFRDALLWLNQGVGVLQSVTDRATSFMFGYLGGGGPRPYEVIDQGADFVVAFRVLPLILVVSALSSVLFHLGVLPWVIGQLSKLLQRVFGVSGALGFAAASSLFLGIIETPLVVKPYLKTMKSHELFAMMTCGMATVAGTVMVLYAAVLERAVPGALGHVIVASVISLPAALAFAHILMPGEVGGDDFVYERQTRSVAQALIQGTNDGIKMIVNIAAIIVVLFALVYLANEVLALAPTEEPLTLQSIVGTLFMPVMWLIGIPWAEAAEAGELMGTKTILNEFVAYLQLGQNESLSEHSRLILTYAMCGFANLGSLGILVGGLGALVPERADEIVSLATRAVFSGTLATLMTGAVIAVIL